MLSYEAARAKVVEITRARAGAPATETIVFAHAPAQAIGRILAENIIADRNYPPFDRSTRDGFALRAADAKHPGARLRLAGESRAGVPYPGQVEPGTCVRIMTGAAVPRGADTVVMQEHVRVEGDAIIFDEEAHAHRNYVLAGSEVRGGEVVVGRGARLGYAELAMAAQVGRSRLLASRRPQVAVLSSGDEVVSVEQSPGPFQIRNSNSISVGSQVALAGGEPVLIGNAPDELAKLREMIERALECDIVVLTGGVSVGK